MHIVQEEIGKPKITEQKTSEFVSIFTVSPLPSGFGTTLGNALRRTLLSSVPGAGITSIRFKGAAHEYTGLTGVSDSVLSLILNLKGVAFRKHSKDSEVITLDKKGKGPVSASDITLSGDTEVLNGELVLTDLDSDGDSLSFEAVVEKGVGYLSAKERQKKTGDDGWILVDTIFSPVKNVRYEVSPARVGENINLDSLEIEVETNGVITPGDAVEFSSQILQSYFEFLQSNPEDPVETEFMADFSVSEDELADADDQESYTPIEILNLSPRTLNALINGNIGSVEEVLRSTPVQLEAMRGFGKKAMSELTEALGAHGYTFPLED